MKENMAVKDPKWVANEKEQKENDPTYKDETKKKK